MVCRVCRNPSPLLVLRLPTGFSFHAERPAAQIARATAIVTVENTGSADADAVLFAVDNTQEVAFMSFELNSDGAILAFEKAPAPAGTPTGLVSNALPPPPRLQHWLLYVFHDLAAVRT